MIATIWSCAQKLPGNVGVWRENVFTIIHSYDKLKLSRQEHVLYFGGESDGIQTNPVFYKII